MEAALADLAAAQWGLVTAAQAGRLGIGRMQLTRLATAGLLSRLSHGVYLSRWVAADAVTDLRAAWLSLDPARTAEERLTADLTDVAVSHASAAELQELGSLYPDRHEFTSGRRRQTRRPDIRLHQRPLPASDSAVVHGLPVTTPARTVVDLLAQRQDTEHVAQILGDAAERGVLDLRGLADRLAPLAAAHGQAAGDGAALLDRLCALAHLAPARA